MPNLNANRPVRLGRFGGPVDVRRLMYQPLIWPFVLLHEARGLRPTLNPKGLQRLADALIDGVGGDLELGGDLLGRQVLADQPQAFELPGTQPCNAHHCFVACGYMIAVRGISHAKTLQLRNSGSPSDC